MFMTWTAEYFLKTDSELEIFYHCETELFFHFVILIGSFRMRWKLSTNYHRKIILLDISICIGLDEHDSQCNLLISDPIQLLNA